MKLAGNPNNPVHFRDDATADELRAEIMKRIATLQDAGLIDLKALPPPHGGVANSAWFPALINRVSIASDFSLTVSFSATQRNLLVSKSAGVDQCQSLKRQRRLVRRCIALAHFLGEPWRKKSGPDLSRLDCIITGLALFAAGRLRE